MERITLYRVKPPRLDRKRFDSIARSLGIKAEVVEAEDAIAVRDEWRTVAYAQPGSKFGGLLFFTDQSVSLGAVSDRLPDARAVKGWADEFLKSHRLLPKAVDKVKIETRAYQTKAVTFNGKQRKEVGAKTELASDITLNGIRVVGPRAKIRMVFKTPKQPALIHRGLWEGLEVYEERDLLRENDAVGIVKHRLSQTRERKLHADVIDARLAYFAAPFCGGPDLLTPFYFIEVQYEDLGSSHGRATQGPRQLFQVPAYR